MNMIVAKILEKNFDIHLKSITNISFNFDDLKIIKINKSLKYGYNKKLILKNIPLTKYNIKKHFVDIYDLRYHYRNFLLNKFKKLWYITESNQKPNTNITNYAIHSNSKYYYFDSTKAFIDNKYFYNNIVNRTPVYTGNQIGNVKYLIRHIIVKNKLSSNLDSQININLRSANNISIYYRPIYSKNGIIENNDLILIKNNKSTQMNTSRSAVSSIKLIDKYNKDNDIIEINDNYSIMKINNNNIPDRGYSIARTDQSTENNLPIYDVFDKKFIYSTFDNNLKKRPLFIKIGKNIESENITESLPTIKLLSDNVSGESNIYPIINCHTHNNMTGESNINPQQILLLVSLKSIVKKSLFGGSLLTDGFFA